MRLYIWEGVLTDWTGGIAFALADTATEAKKLLIKAGIPEDQFDGVKLDGVKPTSRITKCAFYVSGGG